MTTEIVVVPHTHWDREWYEPHDVFRLRLVHMLDKLLLLLEEHPEYRFTLDGQSAAIDDYLEIRPEQRQRVETLVTSGQLSVGPFLILLDEFGCDGETIIRNLELGIASSQQLGRTMPIGYLPDMFGHAAQMPQILRGFGIEHGAMWRGVPGEIQEHAFRWEAPDGTSVRCEYLFDGYGNGLDMFALEGQLPELAPLYAERTASWYGTNPVLAMLGTDHSAPPENLVDVVTSYNSASNQPRISIATLDEHLSRYPTDEASVATLPPVYGEMRSHARGNLLPGVFSIRTNLKHEMGESERALTVAERLDLMYGRVDHRKFFDTAWYRIVESTAHDSVTGCGVDSTALQVGTRISTAGNIARGVIDSVLRDISAHASPHSYLVFNPAGFPRQAHVEIKLHNADLDQLSDNVQVLDALPTVLGDESMSSDELPKILRRIHGRELFGQQINGYEWGPASLRFFVAESPVGVWDLAAFTVELEQRVSDDPAGNVVWRVETLADPRHSALVAVDLGAMGLGAVSEVSAKPITDPVTVTDTSLANGSLTVHVNANGTVRLETADGSVIDGALGVVDEGDCGDSYNYGPVDPNSAVTEPVSVTVTATELGPVRGRISIVREYDVPVGLVGNRRSHDTVTLEVTTVIELRSGEDFLRVSVDYVNTASNHRLRLLVPLEKANVETSASAGQYGVTTRAREAEGGWGEFPLPTFPAYRFVTAGHTSVLVKKLTEYEVVSRDGHPDALALTLSRSVGMMSVNVHPLRDEPAGSEIPVPGAQYLGVAIHTELAITVGSTRANAVIAGELFRLDPVVIRGTGLVDGPLPEPAIADIPSGDVVLESARKIDGVAELRYVNYLDHDTALHLSHSGNWQEADLAGRVTGTASVAGDYSVRAGGIATFRRSLQSEGPGEGG
jgi:mannosylglycerate hydrolase